MRKITNYGASNFRKLLNAAHKNNLDFNILLKRYIQERFLYRLSKSPYRENFILKGGLLLVTIDTPASRPTIDIDLLMQNLSMGKILNVFKEIFTVDYPDGVSFDSSSLESEPITKDGAYHGTRIKFKAYFNGSRNDMSIDLGLGDCVTNPRKITFPTILDEDSPVLTAYSLETIVAEKVEAMAKLLISNSRMKDFYDVYTILNMHPIANDKLIKAIKSTFENRKTKLENLNTVFSSDFYNSDKKQVQWEAFLRKNEIINVPVKFSEIVKNIEKKLPVNKK